MARPFISGKFQGRMTNPKELGGKDEEWPILHFVVLLLSAMAVYC